MRFRPLITGGIGLALLLGLVFLGYTMRKSWLPWLSPTDATAEDRGSPTPRPEVTKVQISQQAEMGLGIVARPIQLREYWRSLEIPGSVVDRPGESDRAIPAPTTGYVTAIVARPGDTLRPGEPLFTLRIAAEFVLNTQAELHKTAKEIQLNAETRERLTRPENVSAVSPGRLIELDQQERRLKAALEASRQVLVNIGLRPEQVAHAEKGTFATEIRVTVPIAAKTSKSAEEKTSGPIFEVQELKVNLGDPVQSGQTVFLLADHQTLYIEGRAFKQEAKALARAAKEDWPVRAEFVEESRGQWPDLGPLTIHHLANAVDPVSRTFAFYLSLPNQADSYTKDGRIYLNWRFRPGQRVRLRVPVERWDAVFVLPTEAVVRDGAEAYVFRRNGDFFERRVVTLLHEDSTEVVLKDDGALTPRQHVVMSGAAALNRALKTLQASGQTSNIHVHADGTTHAH